MKELEKHYRDVTVGDYREIRKRKVPVGSFRHMPGHTVWQLDLKTKTVTPIVFDDTTVQMDGTVKKSLIMKPYFLYCSALNLENANRKFIKIIEKIARDAKSDGSV